MLCPKHVGILAHELSVTELQATLHRKTAVRIADMPAVYGPTSRAAGRSSPTPDAEHLPITKTPEDIEIVVAGDAGNHSVVLPGYGNGSAPRRPIPTAQR